MWVALGIAVAVTTIFSMLLFGKEGRPLWKRTLLGVSEAVGFWGFILWCFPYVNPLLDKYNWLLESVGIRALLAALAILLGAGAHLFKKKNKFRYGQLEAFFGVASASAIASEMTPGKSLFSHCVALVGAAYLVASGFSDWSEELEQNGKKYGYYSIRQNVRAWIFTDDLDETKRRS
jgi:hypothetical protein